jgi:26S proteasome regulatory subunit N1
MAGDTETPKPTDKGKGKAVDDPKKEKPLSNGKKEDEKIVDCR